MKKLQREEERERKKEREREIARDPDQPRAEVGRS